MSTPAVKYRRIWLQVDEPEVSWCQDRIHDSDIEYVAAAVVREMVEKVKGGRKSTPWESSTNAWLNALDAVLAQLEGKP